MGDFFKQVSRFPLYEMGNDLRIRQSLKNQTLIFHGFAQSSRIFNHARGYNGEVPLIGPDHDRLKILIHPVLFQTKAHLANGSSAGAFLYGFGLQQFRQETPPLVTAQGFPVGDRNSHTILPAMLQSMEQQGAVSCGVRDIEQTCDSRHILQDFAAHAFSSGRGLRVKNRTPDAKMSWSLSPSMLMNRPSSQRSL